eukprot:68149-Amorphochlora_amoeboformis.AAC.1
MKLSVPMPESEEMQRKVMEGLRELKGDVKSSFGEVRTLVLRLQEAKKKEPDNDEKTLSRICDHVDTKHHELIEVFGEVKVPDGEIDRIVTAVNSRVEVPDLEFPEKEARKLMLSLLKYNFSTVVGTGIFFGLFMILVLMVFAGDGFSWIGTSYRGK